MKSFQFPLQRVMEWRRMQMEMEEVRFRQQSAAMAGLEREIAQVTAAGNTAEGQVRSWNPIAGGELSALGSYRLHVKFKETELAVPLAECRKELELRGKALAEARRRLRLLERLKERRVTEWNAERDKELDQVAADSYLSKWKSWQN